MGYYDDYLEHHGILGQKWGVRRFQNTDGTLKTAGKKRYSDPEEKKMAKAQKRLDKVTDKLKTTGTAWDNDTFNNKKMEKYRKVEKKYYKELGKVEKKYNVENTGGLNDYAHYKITGKKESNKKGLTDKQKKMIIAGAAVATTALAAYGGYKLHQLNNQKAKANSATNKLASEASSLAKSVTAAGPKRFSKPSQNASQAKSQMTQQKLQSVSKAISSGSKSASNVVKMNGSQKFSKAAKTNDDYVSQMLKRNSNSLSQFSMKDLSNLDLY